MNDLSPVINGPLARHGMLKTAPTAVLDVRELVSLAAINDELFATSFFPKTFRVASPSFAPRMWDALENPLHRRVNLQCYRGSAKTTRLRVFTAKRIAYGMSRTVLYVGGSETAAARSIKWLRRQIEFNKFFANTFGLEPGSKWGETELEIVSRTTGHKTWLIGAGMGASIRGINFDDYRPDLIVCDDVVTDENTLTKESREKTNDMLLGAISGSLISELEEPNAKLVLAQTPLHREDASMAAMKSGLWHTERFGCWTEDTADMPVDEQESSWPELYPTATLRQMKRDYMATGKGYVFLREYEVRIVSPETSVFRPTLLKLYDAASLPPGGTTVVAIDPVPPPTDASASKTRLRGDFEVLCVLTRVAGAYYVRHYEMQRGHTPSWTLAMAFQLAAQFNAMYIAVETVAYQSTLKWLLETEMRRKGIYYPVLAIKNAGKQSKYQRIVDRIGSLLPYGKLYAAEHHSEFISALTEYPAVQHDDLLDAVSIGLQALINPSVELGESEYSEIDESQYEKLDIKLKCP